MLAFSGVSFYMYSPDRFIEYAQKYLKLEVQRRDVESAADELRQVEAEKAAESQRRAEVFEQAHKIVAAYIPPSNVQLQALLEGLAKAKVANQVPVQRLMGSMKVANQDPVQRLMESLKAANQDPAQRLMESLKAAYLDPVQQLMEGLKVAYRDPAQQLMEGLKAYRDMGQQLVEGLKMYRDPVQQLMEGLAKAKVGGSEQPSEILEKPAQPRPVDPPETDGTTNNGEEH